MPILTTRRVALVGGLAATGAAVWGYGAWSGARAYGRMIAATRAPLPDQPTPADLVRYATLAPNGHNTQPWRFAATPAGITISPDTSRRTPVVDPDDHHLFASLGCAAETLRLAARARGLSGEVGFDGQTLSVDLAPGPAEAGAMFEAIARRQSTRSLYDGTPVDRALADRLVAAARVGGVEPVWVSGPEVVSALTDLVIEGNSRQMADPGFVAELKRWIRFNPGAAAARGDGLLSAASGNPSLPDWLGGVAFGLAFRPEAENAKYRAQIASSAGLMVLVAPEDAPAGWVAAGRACQALMLRATAEGLKCAFVNQAVEVPQMRAEVRGLLGLGDRRPSLILRIGRAAEMPMSPRRPVAEVMA